MMYSLKKRLQEESSLLIVIDDNQNI